jgi:hypothetical protein
MLPLLDHCSRLLLSTRHHLPLAAKPVDCRLPLL